MRIGAHVGVGKGWPQAAEYAHEVGRECLQLFTRSPRMWRTAPLDVSAVAEFHERLAAHDIGPVFAHTSYLINLGSRDDELYERSVDGLTVEMSRARQAGVPFVVTHVGTDPTGEPERAAARIADACARGIAAADVGAEVTLLLENSSGSGRHYGGSIAELGRLVSLVREQHAGPVGTCFDNSPSRFGR